MCRELHTNHNHSRNHKGNMWNTDGMKLRGENRSIRRKTVQVPLCPKQISSGLIQDRNRTSVVRGWQLELTAIIYKHSFPTSQKTNYVFQRPNRECRNEYNCTFKATNVQNAAYSILVLDKINLRNSPTTVQCCILVIAYFTKYSKLLHA